MIRQKIQASKLMAQAAETRRESAAAARQHRKDAAGDPAGHACRRRRSRPVQVRLLPVSLLASRWRAALWAPAATPPKPPELEAFEKLRADPAVEAAAERSPDLVSGADRLLARSTEQWQDNELSEARNSALLGQVKLQARAGVRRAGPRPSSAWPPPSPRPRWPRKKTPGCRRSWRRSTSRWRCCAACRRPSQQLTAEQQRATRNGCGRGVRSHLAAELAIKTADTVNAGSHAKVPYSVAVENLARARQELQPGQLPGGADQRRDGQDQGRRGGRRWPSRYTSRSPRPTENKARAEALARDAAAIPGDGGSPGGARVVAAAGDPASRPSGCSSGATTRSPRGRKRSWSRWPSC